MILQRAYLRLIGKQLMWGRNEDFEKEFRDATSYNSYLLWYLEHPGSRKVVWTDGANSCPSSGSTSVGPASAGHLIKLYF